VVGDAVDGLELAGSWTPRAAVVMLRTPSKLGTPPMTALRVCLSGGS
jgi:hypothetical protein